MNYKTINHSLPYFITIQHLIFNKGIIFATESSKITQGLEKELNRIKNSIESQIQNSSLVAFFPELINLPMKAQNIDLLYKDLYKSRASNDALAAFASPKSKSASEDEFNLSEAIELNEQQRETVLSAFKNKLTVVTGPPEQENLRLLLQLL